jgi:hypothetical protein
MTSIKRNENYTEITLYFGFLTEAQRRRDFVLKIIRRLGVSMRAKILSATRINTIFIRAFCFTILKRIFAKEYDQF